MQRYGAQERHNDLFRPCLVLVMIKLECCTLAGVKDKGLLRETEG